VIDVDATLSKDGKITSWHMVSINPGRSGVETPYQAGKTNTQTIESEPPLRHASYRALGSTAHNFARESVMDELAAAAGKDPLEFRLAHLENDRLRDVLSKAAEAFGWKDRRIKTRNVNTGIGLACASEKGSYVAACAEVRVDPTTRTVQVLHVCQAFDAGAVTNPQNLKSQNVGAIIMGLGPLLREQMVFEDGKMLNASFWKYAVPRMSDVPVIEVDLIDRKDVSPAGAGETPLVVIAPAVRNAVYDATETWVREMPLKLGRTS
jgi:isoquinoline 1-oxidoreductase